MPKIEEFNPGQLGLRPSEIGVEATAAAARRGGAFFNQIAAAKQQTGHLLGSGIETAGQAAVAYEEHREISTGAAKGVELFAGLTKSKDEAIKGIDPNDPAYGQKVDVAMKQWREETLEPSLEQYRSGFITQKGQDWAEKLIDKTRTHMWRESTADVSSAAKIGTINSTRKMVNDAASSVYLDPKSGPDKYLDLIDHSIGGMVDSSPLKGVTGASVKSEVAEKAKEQVVKSWAVGAIAQSKDPEAAAADAVKRYPQYITPGEAQQLAQNARSQVRAREADASRNNALAKQNAAKVSDETADKYLSNVDSNDPKNVQTAQQALNDPNLLPKDKVNIVKYTNRQTKPETPAAISRQTTVDLLREMRNPDADNDTLMQKAWDARTQDPGTQGSMTKADFDSFRKEIQGRATPDGKALQQDRGEFFKKYANSIDTGFASMGHTALGSQQMYRAEQDAIRQEKVLKSQGKDPHELYNNSSPNFFGRPENLQKYTVSMQEIQRYENEVRAGRVPPDKPAATTPAPAAASPAKGIGAAPEVGDVNRGYRFKGGDPSDKGNWEKVK